MLALQKYAKAFAKLKRGGTKYGAAPHKPILLLTLIELIEKGIVPDNRVFVDAQLVGTFKENWLLLNDAVSRTYLRQVLLDTYFAVTKNNLINAKQHGLGYLNDQTSDLLEEPQAKLRHVSKYTEEDIFVRNGLFKRLVPRLYQQQCSFTGMSLSSMYKHSFIDACHIVPFSRSQNDSVTNGIALCPNMHRAFDRGLLSIDQDYRILVSEHLTENKNHPYALSALKGRKIILPQQQNHYPAQDALAWHRGKVFKGGLG